MKTQIKKQVLITLILISQKFVSHSAIPDWKVLPENFQYNLTMMCAININCAEQTKPVNMIGVFVNGECRGVAKTNQIINGRYLASLFVYSNTVSGEELTFKAYIEENDSVYELVTTTDFFDNVSFGTAGSPYILYSKQPCYFVKDILPVNNYMSPNGDGINDNFTIDDVISYSDFSLSVFNSFGIEVFYKDKNYNNEWDGKFNGKIVETGTYYYLLKNKETGKSFSGTINIVKPN